MRTLVTGFGPFRNVIDNPSAQLAKRSKRPFTILEVSYEAAEGFVSRLDPDAFDIWLMLGVAETRQKMSLEILGRNQKRGADVRGFVEEGPIDAAYSGDLSATLWTPNLQADLCNLFPDELQVSDDAGAYLCNFLTFNGLRRFPEKRVGFLHVVNPETISLDRQSEIIAAVLQRLEA